MKPLFSIHEGEFLVGDYITRNMSKKYEVWVPAKDMGGEAGIWLGGNWIVDL